MQNVAVPKGNVFLGVGLSLGLSIGVLASNNRFLDRFFPPEPVTEKVVSTVDPKMIEEIISQNRKINQLENLLGNLKEDIRERNHQIVQAPIQTQRSSTNVFELAEVIEANNMANRSRHEREMEEQRRAMMREHLLKVEGEILKVENKYRPVINTVKELEAHLENQRQVQAKEAPARLLWISCQSLIDRLRSHAPEPLEKDPSYGVLKKFAANNNPLAISILDSIPAKALKEGVHSEESLTSRFTKVERTCKRVAMVDANGGGVTKYLLSFIQSLFILDNVEVPKEEIAGNQLVDPTKWTTFDILARVKYCLDRHNLEQAVRYANQLRGQARVVARDWIRDARTHLVTRQAFNALAAQAEAIAVDSVRQNFAES